VVGVIWNYFLNPQGNPVYLGVGVALVVLAIIFDALAYALHARSKRRAAEVSSPPVTAPSRTKPTKGKRKVSSTGPGLKGIALSLVSGILMGSFYPLVEMAKAGENGLGPYAIAFVFAVGVFLSTLVFNLYFMNLPVEGEAISISEYFRGGFKQHALGIVGGVIWCSGAIANFAAASAPKEVQIGPAISYAIGQGATMISALWGLLVWREFAGSITQVRLLLVLMLLLFVAGLASVSVAPLYVVT